MDQPSSPSIVCRDITVCWADGHVPLSHLDLTVAAGQITTLIGPSGSGKTTLLKCMLGLLEPEEGTVTIGDCDVWGADAEHLRRVRRSLSWLQSASILQGSVHGSISVRDNLLGVLHEKQRNARTDEQDKDPASLPVANPYLLAMPRTRHTGDEDDRVHARAEEWLRRLDLAAVADALPDEISGGARRRLALATAISADVALYILDQPDGAIDLSNRSIVTELILDAQRRNGATMLVVTHDLDLAARISDQVVALTAGTIAAQGPPDQMLQCPEQWYM